MKKTHIILLIALMVVLLVSVIWVATYLTGVVPYWKCSEVYRRYAHVEGVEAAFVKGFPINDTLGVDVTLLRATNSAGWDFLVDTFHVSKEKLNLVKNMPELRVFERQGLRNHPEILAITKGENRDPPLTKDDVELCFFDLQEKEICIFHTQSAKEVDAVRGYNYENMMSNKRINLK